MSKLHNMRVIEIPRFCAVSSGTKTLDEMFGRDGSYNAWIREHGHLFKI